MRLKKGEVLHPRKVEEKDYDIVVIGGGVAGLCAAIAAARLGSRVALIQDRPVLGGNASSEIRVWAIGAATRGYFRNARETGIIEELTIEALYRSEGLPPIYAEPFPMWDVTLKEWCDREPDLDCYMNSRAYEVTTEGNRIISVTALQTSTEKGFCFHASLFIESSGDGEIGHQAGAGWRLGQESRHEFGESLAPEEANETVLPCTLLLSTRDVGHPVRFHRPNWAYHFRTDKDLPFRDHSYVQSGYWWISAGGDRDTINDTEEIRDELHKILFGVWDHIKNHGEHGADNLVLDWVGHLVGKRESRRFQGDYIMVQDDVLCGRHFSDAVAYGGWPLDVHPPEGIFSHDVPTDQIEPEKPYSIPYRALYSRNIENLFLNGRLVSATHLAMGSIRVQKTLGLIGQAVGTAAHICLQRKITPRHLGEGCIHELQQLLLKQDCYIPYVRNTDPDDLACSARVTASSHMPLPVVRPTVKHPLCSRRTQKFITSQPRIDHVYAMLVSIRKEAVKVRAHLRSALDLWDFSFPKILATAEAMLKPKHDGWVSFDFLCGVDPSHPCWIEIESVDGVSWYHSPEESIGCQAAARSDKGRVRLKLDAPAPQHAIESDSDDGLWQHLRGTYVFRVEPQSYPYKPENVISGVSRPEQGTNLWIADPAQNWPHWLELDFRQPVTFDTIQLTFDSNLDRQMDEGAKAWTGPVPEIIKCYSFSVWQDGRWLTFHQEEANHQRWKRHTFEPVTTQRLRITLEATHGGGDVVTKPQKPLLGPQSAHLNSTHAIDTARIFEVRVYHEQNRRT
ncbi:FAD-dependent oxidoreductase [Acidobacteria bacterium AH-259-G07]|nr:FAD-dependent oxidoreductase [Acidobacteria bacterium AH-259-G07]